MAEISGVVEWDDGTAISGATVIARLGNAEGPEVATTTTATDGSYTLTVNGDANYHVKAQYTDPDTGDQHQTYSKPYIFVEAVEPTTWNEALHRYNHDEGSGTTIGDTGAASTLSDATMSGGTWDTSVSQYQGVSVDYAAGDTASATNQDSMSGFASGMTMLTWFRYQSQTDGSLYVVAGVNGSWEFEVYDNGWRVQPWEGGSATSYDYYSDAVTPPINTWMRVGFRWSSGAAPELLLDGTSYVHDYTGASSDPSALDSSTTDLMMPETHDVARYMDGPLMIWDRALTDTEVSDDYNHFTA